MNAERIAKSVWEADVRGRWEMVPEMRRKPMIDAAQAELERIVGEAVTEIESRDGIDFNRFDAIAIVQSLLE